MTTADALKIKNSPLLFIHVPDAKAFRLPGKRLNFRFAAYPVGMRSQAPGMFQTPGAETSIAPVLLNIRNR